MIERNITVLSKKQYDDVHIEYGEIINTSVIPKVDGAIYAVWDVYNSHKVTNRKCSKFTERFISEHDRKYIISIKAYGKLKCNSSENKWKHNVSLKVFH